MKPLFRPDSPLTPPTQWAALAMALTFSGYSYGYTVIIDDMQMNQGSAGAPAVTQTGPGSSAANTLPDAGIYGGYRHIGVTVGPGGASGAYAASWVDKNGSDAPLGTWQVASPSGNDAGFGEIWWNGSASPVAANFDVPLDLTKLIYFTVNYLFADHPTSFYLQAWSSAGNCTQAKIADVNSLVPLENIQVAQSQFNQSCGVLPAADLTSIKKLRILFTGGQIAIDTDLRGLSGVFEEPPSVECLDKTINGVQSYSVSGPGPYNLTVGIRVQNTGGSSQVTIQDIMPPGMVPAGALSCLKSGGGIFDVGSVRNPPFTWDSSSFLAEDEIANCTLPATLTNLEPGQSLTNLAQAGQLGQTVFAKQCRATIYRPSTPDETTDIPTMNQWAMTITAILLTLLGGFSLRRTFK